MFTGLSAFPLTPMVRGEVDVKPFLSLIENLAQAGVDSIGALGSTGSYAWLTREQRLHTTQLAVSAAAGTPVMTSIGSVSGDEVLRLADDAQKAGVSGVLLAPVSYQPLRSEEVFSLYERVSRELSVPLCIYDNVATTRFAFTDELLIALARLKHIGSIKLGDFPADPAVAAARVSQLKAQVPEGVTIGISGDAQATAGLLAGCDVWYSVLGGLFPRIALSLTRAARSGDKQAVQKQNAALEPLWAFYRRHGSLRVIAALAEIEGRVASPCLPFPLQALGGNEREALQQALVSLDDLA